MWVWIGLLALAGAVGWIVRRHKRDGRDDQMTGWDRDDPELRAAEDEVRDLDAFATPEDADDQLPDWGPGAGPGPRR